MQSIWRETPDFRERPALSDDIIAPVAIIGGGLAGILTVCLPWQKGIESIVLETNRIGNGQTQNATAKITSQHSSIYTKLFQNFSEEEAKQYASVNQQAIGRYRQMIMQEQIDCRFEGRPAYLYSVDREDIPALEMEMEYACRAEIHAELVKKATPPFETAAAIQPGGQAQLYPLKFLQAISELLTVYEKTKALLVEGRSVMTDRGTVTAEHIAFASHFPFVNASGCYFMCVYQECSYVLALQNAAGLDGTYLSVGERGLSMRNHGDILLLDGGDHRTDENKTGGEYDMPREMAALFYPQSRELARWSVQDCMTLDSVPYIGQFFSSIPNWYVATGFGKWGMTSSVVSAILLSDQIAGDENPFASVFPSSRFTPGALAKNFLSGMGQAAKDLAKQTFSLSDADSAEPKTLPDGHDGMVIANGKKAGAYEEEQEDVTTVLIKCPHLGCQLEWNPDEKSWDHPCHGSRPDAKGGLFEGPAQIDPEETPI